MNWTLVITLIALCVAGFYIYRWGWVQGYDKAHYQRNQLDKLYFEQKTGQTVCITGREHSYYSDHFGGKVCYICKRTVEENTLSRQRGIG